MATSPPRCLKISLPFGSRSARSGKQSEICAIKRRARRPQHLMKILGEVGGRSPISRKRLLSLMCAGGTLAAIAVSRVSP